MPMLTDSKSFIQNEFNNLNLGDARLNKRALKVASLINSSPAAPIPEMTAGSNADLKGLYRFFQNDKVVDQALLETHFLNTLDRMESYSGKILLVNDSCFITPTKGFAGLLTRGKGKENCVRCHYCLAVSEDGVHIFGILSFHVLTNPIQERYPDLRDESDIWIKSAQDCLDLIHTRANPEKLLGRCLFMADREGDEFELLHFLTENNLGFIIRSQYDRLINVDEDAVKLNELEASSVKHGKVYTVMTKVKHELKEVRVQRSTLRDVEINPPISGAQGLPSIMANVVLVKAVEGEECEIKWRLYTSEPIANADESKFIVTCYTHRWKIEEVNKGAKTGVSIEDRQFTDLDHFIPFLAVSFVVAWRIVALRTVVEVNPTVRIEEGFTEDEVAYLKAQSEERGGEMKTIKDALNLIARLGGFTGSYARPGWQILWRGWIRFYERVAGFVLAKNYDF